MLGQRIMVIGNCGAGKTTLAKKIAEITGVELIHLDKNYWQAGWVETEKTLWEQQMQAMVAKPAWIMDGNYGGTMNLRIAKADTVIWLDYSRWICLYRVLKRIIRNYKKTRDDMAANCPERFSWQFIHYVFFFNEHKRPKLLQRTACLKSSQKLILLKNDKSVRSFVNSLTSKNLTDFMERKG